MGRGPRAVDLRADRAPAAVPSRIGGTRCGTVSPGVRRGLRGARADHRDPARMMLRIIIRMIRRMGGVGIGGEREIHDFVFVPLKVDKSCKYPPLVTRGGYLC